MVMYPPLPPHACAAIRVKIMKNTVKNSCQNTVRFTAKFVI